ncbi:MAG: glycosyltransferase family 9 protein [Candidatus Melainabacteria bacterium]|nr:glycosyltransferase family 9 protein [Candidatus Melainabacteria bacterium]
MINNGKKSEAPKKILAINFGGIGDEILFLPTLETIRSYAPNATITLLLEPRSRSVQELTDLVDQTVTFDIKKRPLAVSDLIDLLSLIKEGAYDCIVSSGSSPLVSALLFLSGVRERVGYGSSRLGAMLLTEPVPLVRKQYAACMYHDLAIGFLKQEGITPPAVNCEKLVPKVVLKADSLERMTTFLNESGAAQRSADSQLLLLHPGTSRLATEKGIIKTWSTESWIELLQMISKRNETKKPEHRDVVIIAGGPDDREIIESIESKLDKQSPYVVSAYGKTKNISDLAALMYFSDLVVCVDSAPMHVAVGLTKPLVALFGPTDPALLLPKNPRFKAVWDARGGTRSMFDGMGVHISAQDVFDCIYDAAGAEKTAITG